MKWVIASLGLLLILAIAPAHAQEIKERLTFQGPKGDIAHVVVSPKARARGQ